MLRFATLAPCLTLCLAIAGCAPEAGPEKTCSGGKCDDPREGVDDADIEAFPCDDVFVNRSTRRNPDGSDIERFVGRLNDPLTDLVYKGGECPLSMEDIMAALREAEDNCGPDDGVATRVVSEEAQILPAAVAGYRAVTTKTCGDRAEFELLFSNFGLSADSTAPPPTGVEVIAFDKTSGVFNFYKEVNGRMGFFGSTLDFLFDGAQGPGLTDVNGCANCHAGSRESGRGNLNMKELRNPWMHWEGSATTDGAEELIKRLESSFGARKTGPNLESLVKAGNRANNSTVIDALLAARDYKRLLRPLFCTEQVNIASGRDNRVPGQFMVVPRLLSGSAANVSVSAAGYRDLIAAIDQVVPGTDITDTRMKFAFLERSFDDTNYVDQLIDRGIIDRQFAADVLAVDFTRPLFSDDRCDLHELAPDGADLAPDELSAETLRAAFIGNLAGAAAGTPAGQLLAHLEATEAGASFDHEAIAKSFIAACAARDDGDAKVTVDVGGEAREVSPFQADAMKIRSRNRQIAFEFDGALDDADGSDARPHKVFEFPRTLATDNIRVTSSAAADDPLAVHPEARFHPVDCTLVNEFVAVEK